MDKLPEMADHGRKPYEIPAGFMEVKLGWRLLFLYSPEAGEVNYKYGDIQTTFNLAEYAGARERFKDARGFVDIRIHRRLVCKYRASDTTIWYKHGKFDAEFKLSDYVASRA